MFLLRTIKFKFAAMLSNAQSKYIRSLTQQKYRKQYKVFLAEGDKIAKEWLMSDATLQMILATQDWATDNEAAIKAHPEAELCIVTEQELEKVSTLQTPNKALVVAHIPNTENTLPTYGWCFALEQLQDPGNMGTIIRIADWFGMSHVVASPDSVDFYNPKVVQAAMGGHLRVSLVVADIAPVIKTTALPVFAAVLGGDSIYEVNNPGNGVILIGNESKGLPQELIQHAEFKVTIPKKGGAESLNAGVSAGIIAAILAGR